MRVDPFLCAVLPYIGDFWEEAWIRFRERMLRFACFALARF